MHCTFLYYSAQGDIIRIYIKQFEADYITHILTGQPCIYFSYHFRKCCSLQSELQPTFLCFQSLNTELDYWKCPDPYFKYYVSCSALLFVLLASMQIILIPV